MALVPYRVSGAAADQRAAERLLQLPGGITLRLAQWPEQSGAAAPTAAASGFGARAPAAPPPPPLSSLANVGLVVWQAGFLLADYLLRARPLGPDASAWAGLTVVDLGTGSGVVGIALAAAGARVFLTDLPHVLPLAAANLAANCGSDPRRHGAVVCPYAWGDDPAVSGCGSGPGFGPDVGFGASAGDGPGAGAGCASGVAAGPGGGGKPLQSSSGDEMTSTRTAQQQLRGQQRGQEGGVQEGGGQLEPLPGEGSGEGSEGDAVGATTVAAGGASARSSALSPLAGVQPDLITAADVLYHTELLAPLMRAIAVLSAPHTVTYVSYRVRHGGEVAAFRALAEAAGFVAQEVPQRDLHEEYRHRRGGGGGGDGEGGGGGGGGWPFDGEEEEECDRDGMDVDGDVAASSLPLGSYGILRLCRRDCPGSATAARR